MSAKRRMGRGAAIVLLAMLGFVAVVGSFGGSAFAEGDTSGTMEERGGEETGKPLWRDVVNVVSALAVVVIGVATLYVMFQQKRLGQRQMAWEREYGRRQEALALSERRQQVFRAMLGFVKKGRALDFVAEVVGRGGVIGKEEGELLRECCYKAQEVEAAMERARKEGKSFDEAIEEGTELDELIGWWAEAMNKLGKAWIEPGGSER